MGVHSKIALQYQEELYYQQLDDEHRKDYAQKGTTKRNPNRLETTQNQAERPGLQQASGYSQGEEYEPQRFP